MSDRRSVISWPTNRELASLPWAAAKERKWLAGREHHGPKWVGDPPLLEMYAELVDAGVYLAEAGRRGNIDEGLVKYLDRLLSGIAEYVRAEIDREERKCLR